MLTLGKSARATNGAKSALTGKVVRGARVASRQSEVGMKVKSVGGVMKVSGVVERSFFSSASVKYAAEWEGIEKEILSMPALSPSMTTGNIASWVKKEGDKISAGDVIAEVETDKATVAFEATEDGYLAKILQPDGAKNIEVADPIAIVVAKKELVAKFANYVHESKSSSSSSSSSAPAASKEDSSSTSSSSPKPKKKKAEKPAAPSVPHSILPMPSLSPTMEDGVIVSWKKNEGDKISAGDVLAEVETDKATVAFEATEDGFMAKILQPAGSTRVKVNVPVAIVVEKKADIDAVKDYNPSAADEADEIEEVEVVEKESKSGDSKSQSKSDSKSDSKSSGSSASSHGGRVIASPYAKVLSKEKGFEIADISGSGPNGRVIASDVLSFTPKAKASAEKTASKSASGASSSQASIGDFDDLSVSNIKRVTAERLTHSKQTIPHFYLTVDVEVDEMLKVREKLNKAASSKSKPEPAYKISVNDFVVKASALAMRQVPTVNSQWMGDFVRQFHAVDINVAVSTDLGLLTPIVRDADLHGLQHISNSIKEASAKAKSGKLSPNDLTTGTFTISNLGMFGIDHFGAVINPPQACILAVGGSKPKVVPNPTPSSEQPFTVKNYMTVTLSCDHRVVDGAVGAQWLQAFKDLIENPMKLLL